MSKPTSQIALVDDHSLLRGSLASLISSFEGYKVIFEADNGKDFIKQLNTYLAPDIVLLDVTMPVMNGFETAIWIRKHLPETRILVLSMMDNEAAIISMVKAGCRGYILKDSKPHIFKQALDDIRDSGFYMNDLVSNKMLNYVMGTEKSKDADIISILSEKEIIFLKYACTEMTYKQIAVEMKLSPRTVESYRDELFRKLNVMSRVGLVIFTIRNGLYKL